MYHIPIATHNRIVRGEVPILYMVIETHLGDRVYAKKTITATAIAGTLGCLARVLSFGSFERTLSPKKDDVLASYTRKQQQHISVTLDNADKYFSIMLGKEPFLSRPISILIGFEDEAVANHITIFKGVISEVSVLSVLTIEADEKSSNSPTGVTLDDTFYLPRAGSYTNPLNTADLLPIVYGDCSDGDEGVWTLPCIDTVNFVYCYACHPVMSDTVDIYSNGVLVDPGDYTFNSSHYFEPPVPPPAIHTSDMNIATVTFDSDQGTNVITARGKGKIFLPVGLAGEVLIENIVDIVNDLLTAENDFTSALFEASKKAQASQIFDKWSYKAAGVINQDGTLWEIITEMMSSFLGSAYLNGNGELCLEIDDGTIDQYSAGTPPTLPKQETILSDSGQRLFNVINQCPVNYAYNYAAGEFKRETDDTAHADGISQGVYGIRKPDTPYQCYWCRDLTTVQLVQDTVVGKFNSPLYEIDLEDITLKRMHIDVGDAVIYSADALYDQESNALIDNIWRVISVQPDFASGKITFRLLQIFYRSAVPKVIPTPWDGILKLTVPDVPTISVDTDVIAETPVAPDDPIELTVPAVPTLNISTLVHNSRECTISIDEPGLVTCEGHEMADLDMVFFKTTGALPTGITAGDWWTGGKYYVRNKTADDFNLSVTPAGALIDTSGSQSGVHRCFGETMAAPAGKASGGTITYDGSYTVHTFTTDGDFTVDEEMDVEALVVAGGGAGGTWCGAGGGGGGVLYEAEHAVTVQTYSITVGDGGPRGTADAPGANGEDSVFDDMTAVGGGGGGAYPTETGANGGSGGGGAHGGTASGGTGTAGPPRQGYDGGQGHNTGDPSGGGGGAGEVGHTAAADIGGTGAIGVEYSQFASVGGSPAGWFAGGGGGSGPSIGVADANGGGGDGSDYSTSAELAENGVANTGGGGGGGWYHASNSHGGGGGKGIVIIRYLT